MAAQRALVLLDQRLLLVGQMGVLAAGSATLPEPLAGALRRDGPRGLVLRDGRILVGVPGQRLLMWVRTEGSVLHTELFEAPAPLYELLLRDEQPLLVCGDAESALVSRWQSGVLSTPQRLSVPVCALRIGPRGDSTEILASPASATNFPLT